MYQSCCKKCGSISLHTETKGNNIGLYCDDCGAWQKWVSKDELRAFEHSMREATREKSESVDKCIKSISKPTGVNFKDNSTIIEKLQKFIEVIDTEINCEYEKIPKSTEDNIRKNAYCYGLEKCKTALCNIIEGRNYNDLGE